MHCRYCDKDKSDQEMKTKFKCVECNKSEKLLYSTEYYKLNKEERLEYRKNRKEEISIYNKSYKDKNKIYIKEYNKQYKLLNKEDLALYDKKYELSLPSKYKRVLRSAKRKKIEADLTLEEYIFIVDGKKCYYCDDFFYVKEPKGYKIDRLDNTIGYTADNCVCCCSFCNFIKGKLLTPEEAKVAIRAIINYRKSQQI
jgi:hypothetical protein